MALLALTIPAAPAVAKVAEHEVREYREDFGVSTAQAESTLAVQAAGNEVDIVGQLQGVLGDQYAGVWFDNDAAEFVIPLVPDANASHVRARLEGLNLAEAYRTTPAVSSWGELEAVQESVDDALADLFDRGLVQTFLDARANAVVVRQASGATAEDSAQLRRLVAGSGPTVELRPQSRERLEVSPTACEFVPSHCSKPLRAGVGLWPNGSFFTNEAHCTVGFKAIGNVYGNRFVLTAGHCVSMGGAWMSLEHWQWGQKIGTAEQYVEAPQNDYAKINANGSEWDKGPWPTMVAWWGTNQEHSITSESSSYMGQQVCHAGANSGASCGTVTAVNLTSPQPEGPIEHRTEVQPICSKGGDSGGPVFAGNTALGLFTHNNIGVNGENPPYCSEKGYYTEIIEAGEALGVSVAPRVGARPVATTKDASGVGPRSATLNGAVDPNGVSTTYIFQYGTSTAYGSSTPVTSAGSGWQGSNVSAGISGLVSNTTYHYRLVASNALGSVNGADKVFTTAAAPPIVTTLAPSGVTTTEATLNAKVNPNGNATTYRLEYGPTTSYGTKVPVPDASAGTGTGDVSVSKLVSGLKPEHVYHYRVVATNKDGTSYGADRRFSTDTLPATHLSSFGASGTGNGQFARPVGMARDAAGTIYVADADNDRIQKFSPSGEYVGQFGTKGTGNGQLDEPRDVAVAPSGNVWVVDAGNQRIQEFTPAGTYVRQAGVPEALGIDRLGIGYGVEVDSEGNVWVTDQSNRKLVEFDATGKFIRAVGPLVDGWEDELEAPAGLTIDSEGDPWFTDSTNNRVYELEQVWYGYDIQERFGATGTAPGQLSEPRGIAFRPSGAIAIADKVNNRVQIFSTSGEALGLFGTKGSGAGQMSEPRDVIPGPGGVLYVSDTNNNRIQRWSQPWEPEATTLPASNLKATEATLNGTVNPSGAATTYHFEWGKTTAYGNTTASQSAGSGNADVAVSQTLTGLLPETTYHRRLVATNSLGTTYGNDRTLTTPSVPTSAFQAPTGYLWTYSSATGGANAALGMKSGTSPAIALLSGSTHELAFQANDGNLWIAPFTAGAVGTASNTGLGMLAGTSPAIAPGAANAFTVAFQANNNELWTRASGGTYTDTGNLMRPGTSPSIATLTDGTYRVAYSAPDFNLSIYTQGSAGSFGTGKIVAEGSSPAIAPTPSGGWVAAFQASNNELWTYTSSHAVNGTGVAMKAGTSPAIVVLSDGSYRIAVQDSNGKLVIYSSATGTKTTGLAMLAGTSPSITSPPPGGYEVAFQDSSGKLTVYSSSGTSNATGLGMMAGTGPGIG